MVETRVSSPTLPITENYGIQNNLSFSLRIVKKTQRKAPINPCAYLYLQNNLCKLFDHRTSRDMGNSAALEKERETARAVLTAVSINC
ncbi:hypothetical protein, partial [Nostoc sp.]